MIDKPLNEVISDIVKRQMPATFKKAVISKVNYQTATADVFFPTSPQNIIKDVPFASNINVPKVSRGMTCRVDVFDESNINDMVIAYTYGSNMSGIVKVNFGTASVATGGTTIAHGLGDVPDFVGITPIESASTKVVYQYQSSTATNIYLKSPTSSTTVNWVAIKI